MIISTKKIKKLKLDGFSLLEVAIVLCIIGVISGVGLPALTTAIKQKRIHETESNMEQITASLAAYVMQNAKLPLAATPGASAEEAGKSGDLAHGIVPYRTIGLSERTAKDGYNRWISYGVDVHLTRTIKISDDDEQLQKNADPIFAPNRDPFSSDRYFCGIKGGTHESLSVKNAHGHDVIDADSHDLIAFVLISHGASGAGSYDKNGAVQPTSAPDKATNADRNNNFIDHSPSFDFDDRVQWITRNNLLAIYAKKVCRQAIEENE
ncbi:MAG: type II secretion system protein [Alphaproteobacteria bacterium]|nr:type II secretion system protein [Alphaproteobacteria bacterium]